MLDPDWPAAFRLGGGPFLGAWPRERRQVSRGRGKAIILMCADNCGSNRLVNFC